MAPVCRRALVRTLLFALALFSKEEGIGTCAYLAAYALCIDPKGCWRGCLALAPYADDRRDLAHAPRLVGLRRSERGHLRRSADRPDPVPGRPGRAPARHAASASGARFRRKPVPSCIDRYRPSFWWSAVGLVALLLFAVAPLLKRDRLARFWLAGMVFAAVPVCATLPMDRLLTFVGLGAFGLLAQFWELVFTPSGDAPQSPWWRIPARALAWFFVVVHAIWAPLFSPCRSTSPIGPFWVEHRLYVNAPLGPSIGEKTLVVVNAPSVAHAAYLGFRQLAAGKPIPRHTRVLAPAVPSVIIRRLDEHTLEITPGWGYLNFVLDQVFRSERRPMAVGQEVKLTGMTARVNSLTSDGRPAVVTFRFDEPLESPSFIWLCFRGQSFEPFTLPAIGKETEIRFDWRAMFKPPGL